MRTAPAVVTFALATLLGCASPAAPPPKPPPPDPAEEIVAALTASLKLDPAQQQKTRQLMKEMADRNDRIQAGWSNGERVRPEMIFASRRQFEQDFVAILTEEQRKTFIAERMRLMLEMKRTRS